MAGDYEEGMKAQWKKQYSTAFMHYTKACDSGNMTACVYLGGMYEAGEGVKKSIPSAVECYTKACNGGNAIVCRNLGNMYINGNEEINKDSRKASELFAKACDLKDTEGCQNYAMIKQELGK